MLPGASWKTASLAAEPSLTYSVCASSERTMHGIPFHLLAVCGNLDMGGHGEPGRVDTYLLQEESGKVTLAGANEGIESGSYGEPGKVSIVQIGEQLFGFQVHSGHSGQLDYDRLILLAADHGIRQVAQLYASWRSDGPFDCEERPDDSSTGIELAYAVSLVSTDPTLQHWPLSVRVQGEYDCTSVDHLFLIPFSTEHGIYEVPAVLEEAPYEAGRRAFAPTQRKSQ